MINVESDAPPSDTDEKSCVVVNRAPQTPSDPLPSADGAAALAFRETQRFRVFRRHARDLYQLVTHLETPWPTLTVQFMPYIRRTAQPDFFEQLVITGSHTAGAEQNYLKVVSMVLPSSLAAAVADGDDLYDKDVGDFGGFGRTTTDIRCRVSKRAYHNGSVLKARYMPHNPNVIATTSDDGSVYLFDLSRIGETRPPNNPPRPLLPLFVEGDGEQATDDADAADVGVSAKQRSHREARRNSFYEAFHKQGRWDNETGAGQHDVTLIGREELSATESGASISTHRQNAWSLDWSTERSGYLASGDRGGTIRVWDVATLSRDGPRAPSSNSRVHGDFQSFHMKEGSLSGGCNDVKWSRSQPHGIAAASASSDQPVAMFDCRAGGSAVWSCRLPNGATASCLDWSLVHEHIIAVGSTAGEVCIVDVRQSPGGAKEEEEAVVVRRLATHDASEEVTSVAWCPFSASRLASGGQRGDVVLSDVGGDGDGLAGSDAAAPAAPSTTTTGPPLARRFVHTGHTGCITDLGWNWQDCWAGSLLSSDDTAICMWRPRNRFW